MVSSARTRGPARRHAATPTLAAAAYRARASPARRHANPTLAAANHDRDHDHDHDHNQVQRLMAERGEQYVEPPKLLHTVVAKQRQHRMRHQLKADKHLIEVL